MSASIHFHWSEAKSLRLFDAAVSHFSGGDVESGRSVLNAWEFGDRGK